MVDDLTPILISISQLSDQDVHVNFTRDECIESNKQQVKRMKGVRSLDNCYVWSPIKDYKVQSCRITKVDEGKLWHKKLGHLNLRSMKKIITKKAIAGAGIPELIVEE